MGHAQREKAGVAMSPAWPICFGLETEIGIAVADDPDADVVDESIRLVRAAARFGAARLWDYAEEDPHRDARGFRARELRQDSDEAGYISQDARRPLSFEEIKSDLVLKNGARFYNDHAHPEYSTPECGTLAELVAHDKASERILMDCAQRVAQTSGRAVELFKNNTDFRGHSYGCHDNYLISRTVPWQRLVEGMLPFLVTRQIFAGAGKVGWEAEDRPLRDQGGFQIAQRSDFFTELVGIDTMSRRPIINTRDEAHADPDRFRRFHVIVGDANLSEWSTWLKVGTTGMMLLALEEDALPGEWTLADPLGALVQISRDASFQWSVQMRDGSVRRATEVQRGLLEWVRSRVEPVHTEQEAVLKEWEAVLETLETDPMRLRHRLDWVAKRWLLDQFREAEGLDWTSAWMQSLDLEFTRLDRESGLYFGMEQAGDIERISSDDAVQAAMEHPPRTTRAYVRGRCVAKFAEALESAQWDHVSLRVGGRVQKLDLRRVPVGAGLEAMREAVDRADTPEELWDWWGKLEIR